MYKLADLHFSRKKNTKRKKKRYIIGLGEKRASAHTSAHFVFLVDFAGFLSFTVGVFAAKVIKAAAKYIFGFVVPISRSEFLLAL